MSTRLASLLTPHAQSVWPQPTQGLQHRGSLAVSFELSLSWQTLKRIQTRVNDLELRTLLSEGGTTTNTHEHPLSLNSSFKQLKSNFLALTTSSVWHMKKSLCVLLRFYFYKPSSGAFFLSCSHHRHHARVSRCQCVFVSVRCSGIVQSQLTAFVGSRCAVNIS